jgi:fucose permease
LKLLFLPNALHQGRLTAAGFIGLYLHGIVVATPGAFLGQWRQTFGESVHVSLFYTFFLVSSLTSLTWAARQKNRHPLLALSFIWVGLAFEIAAWAPNFAGVAGAALVLGLGDGILNFHCNNLVGELHPQGKIRVLNWANATFGLGALSAPLLNTLLPWRLAFVGVGVAAILAFVLAWQAPPVQAFRPTQDRVNWSGACPFLLITFLYVGLESAIATWSGSYLQGRGWHPVQQSALLSAYWGALTLGRLSLGVWVSPRPIQRLRGLLGIGMVAIALTPLPGLGFLFVGAALCYGPTFPTIFALLQERCGHVALGYLFYAVYLGKTLVPTGLDQIPDPLDLHYGFLGLALLLYFSSYGLSKTSPSSSR